MRKKTGLLDICFYLDSLESQMLAVRTSRDHGNCSQLTPQPQGMMGNNVYFWVKTNLRGGDLRLMCVLMTDLCSECADSMTVVCKLIGFT